MPLWRETFRSPRVGKLDARVSFFVFPPLMPILRLETTICMVVAIITLYVVEVRYGMSFPSAIRYVRAWMAGPIRRPSGLASHLIDIHAADVAIIGRQRTEADQFNSNIFTRMLRLIGVDARIKNVKKNNKSK